MLSYFNRLKSKKGFTLIELIVVIAIMGVLLAMILPAMTGSNKDEIGKGLAKDFFYRVQDVMCNVKMSNPDAFSDSTFNSDHEVVFYADIDAQGVVTDTGILRNTNNTNAILKLSAPYVQSSYDQTFVSAFDKFSQSAEEYVTRNDSMTGTLYAVVAKDDRQVGTNFYTAFSVQAAYWSDMPTSVLTAASTITVESDNVASNGYYCCAYPARLSMSGETMFVY